MSAFCSSTCRECWPTDGERRLRTRHPVERDAVELRREVERHVRPRAHVGGLVLHPADLLEVRVPRELGLELLDRARVELLDPDDRRGRGRRPRCFLRSTIRSQVIRPLHSSTFSHLAPGRPWSSPITGRKVPSVKSAGCEAASLRLSIDFGREHDQRPVLLAERVLAQQVEVARRGRRLGDHERVVGGHRQEPLDARRGVVGALALVAVRQQQHDAGLLAPLGVAGGDELVDHGLGAVDEVAELRLPQRPARRAGPPSSRTRSRARRTPRAASRRRRTAPGPR